MGILWLSYERIAAKSGGEDHHRALNDYEL
jgi:hypothetical protein